MTKWLIYLFIGLVLLAPSLQVEAKEYVPRRAYAYQHDLIRNTRAVWGINAPIAVFAGQIHQESLWRPDAKSAYAHGLTQFTPDTAVWISTLYKNELGEAAPYNPGWALRALARYDYHLYGRLVGKTECDKWAFTLSAYNGGLGWVLKDKKLAKAKGKDPFIWFGHVEMYNAGRGAAFFHENRGYPKRILLTLQPLYASWGPSVVCTP